MSQPKGQQMQREAVEARVEWQEGEQPEAAEEFATLIDGLTRTLTPIEPGQDFAQRLRRELLDAESGGMLSRWRGMPARVHIAAALALLAGFGLLLTRRLFGSDEAESIVEEGVAAAH